MGQHDITFSVIRSPGLLVDSYRLRHAVYCRERAYKPPGNIDVDFDEHDADAIHIAATHRGQILASVRLILKSDRGFPLFHHSSVDSGYQHIANDKRCAEVSRFVIPRSNRSFGLARQLYKTIEEICAALDVDRWIAAMEPTLATLLQRAGYEVQQIGPKVSYLGVVSPYLVQTRNL